MGEMSGETWKEGKGSEGGTLGEGMSGEGHVMLLSPLSSLSPSTHLSQCSPLLEL